MEAHKLLEKELGKWLNLPAENVVVTSSGTAALHLALEAFQILPGSKVLCPDFTMIACARAISMAGLTPVFIDCDSNLLMDLDLVDSACSFEVEAIMPVHIYGRLVNLEEVNILAKKYGIRVIEDCAECHLSGETRPYTSDAATFSFYKNKLIFGQEGGAVIFKEKHYADRARSLRSLGFTEAHDFQHIPRGMNYRLADTLAALILTSLSEVEANFFKRRQIEHWYNLECPDVWRMPRRDSPWVYDVRVRGMGRGRMREVVEKLREEKVEARCGFYPLCSQEEYTKTIYPTFPGSGEGRVADRMAEEVFYLPIQPGITTQEQVKRSFEIIRSVLK